MHTEQLPFFVGGGGGPNRIQNSFPLVTSLHKAKDNFSKKSEPPYILFVKRQTYCTFLSLSQHNWGGKKSVFRGVKAGSLMAPTILWATSRMQLCTHFHGYQTTQSASISTFPGGCTCPAKEQQCNLLINVLLWNSIGVSGQSTLYYLNWVCVAQSRRVRADITSGVEGPRERDLPAAAAAARSSLLSVPITGASVPTKINSVVQLSVQPLPLPELLPSSPAVTNPHKITTWNKG